VFGQDLDRLGEEAAKALTHTELGRVYMRMSDGHCAALQLDAGAFRCGIYHRRPEACRALARGSSACLDERSTKLRVARRLLPILP
jgi:Fe-S-cluster containining protein